MTHNIQNFFAVAQNFRCYKNIPNLSELHISQYSFLWYIVIVTMVYFFVSAKCYAAVCEYSTITHFYDRLCDTVGRKCSCWIYKITILSEALDGRWGANSSVSFMGQLDYIGTLLQAIGIDLDLILATMVSYFIGPFAFHYCVHFLLLDRNALIIASFEVFQE